MQYLNKYCKLPNIIQYYDTIESNYIEFCHNDISLLWKSNDRNINIQDDCKLYRLIDNNKIDITYNNKQHSKYEKHMYNMRSRNNNAKYCVQEYVNNGDTLEHLIDKLCKEDIHNIIQQIICICKYSYDRIRFIHNDLHMSNIIVIQYNSHITLEYGDYKLKSNYIAKIIDFENSTCKYNECMYRNTKCRSFYFKCKTWIDDITLLLNHVKDYRDDIEGIDSFVII